MIPGSSFVNRHQHYHDVTLDGFVESARHAVALDERRSMFPPVLFGDLTTLNAARGHVNEDERAPFQERWFPGVHGSVGGGGDIRGLSDGTLAWVLKGAKLAGLKLDTEAGTRIHSFHPDPMAPLINVKKPEKGFTDRFTTDRAGPEHLWQLSSAARRRWSAPSPIGTAAYRPNSLSRLAHELVGLPPWSFQPPTDLIATVKVEDEDTLSKYAVKYYGNAKLWPHIHHANLDTIEDPDDIFPGQTVRIPQPPIEAAPSLAGATTEPDATPRPQNHG